MMTIHPDTGYVFARQHCDDLIAEAQRMSVTRDLDNHQWAHRLVVATGRMLERAGERLQGIPAAPLSWQSEQA